MILRELITVLGFQTDEVGLKKAENGFKSLLKASAGLIAGVAAVGAGLFALTKQTADVGDAARDAGKRLGITASAVQELEFAAGQSGVSMGALESGMKFLQRAAVDSTKGNKRAAQSFAQLGVKVRDSNGQIKSAPELLKETVGKLEGVKNASQKTALAMQLFGRGAGTSVLQLEGLNENIARARELGGIISDEDADVADNFNDSLGEMSTAITGITRRLGVRLMPIFKQVIDAVTEWTIANRQLIDRGLDALAKVVRVVTDGLMTLGHFIDQNRGFMARFIAAGVTPLIGALGMLFIAQVKALAPMALAVLGWTAFAAIIALVTEEIDAFITGDKKSVLQDLVNFLDMPQKADEHAAVTVLRVIRDMANEAIDGVRILWALLSRSNETIELRTRGESGEKQFWNMGAVLGRSGNQLKGSAWNKILGLDEEGNADNALSKFFQWRFGDRPAEFHPLEDSPASFRFDQTPVLLQPQINQNFVLGHGSAGAAKEVGLKAGDGVLKVYDENKTRMK